MAQCLPRQHGEPNFDLIQPRGVDGEENGSSNPFMAAQELAGFFAAMSCTVVEDEVKLLVSI
jgi:hypothetical protein